LDDKRKIKKGFFIVEDSIVFPFLILGGSYEPAFFYAPENQQVQKTKISLYFVPYASIEKADILIT
jgi:hypothetical protein